MPSSFPIFLIEDERGKFNVIGYHPTLEDDLPVTVEVGYDFCPVTDRVTLSGPLSGAHSTSTMRELLNQSWEQQQKLLPTEKRDEKC